MKNIAKQRIADSAEAEFIYTLIDSLSFYFGSLQSFHNPWAMPNANKLLHILLF